MKFSPCRWLYRKPLYRSGTMAVMLTGLVLLAGSRLGAQATTPVYGRKTAPDKGPRALGLVQLSAKGKARIIPIAIMMDGKFYDAGAYKADPVPRALDFGTVYEGFRDGVSQGIFTITQPGQLNHDWIAEGRWIPAGAVDPLKKKKYAPPVIAEEDKDDRPVLHRRVAKSDAETDGKNSNDSDKDKEKDNKDKDKDTDKNKNQPAVATAPATATASTAGSASPSASAPASGTGASTADAGKGPASSTSTSTSPSTSTSTSTSTRSSADSTDETISDPNRPRLRRGKPDTSEQHEPFTTFAPLTEVTASPGANDGNANAGAKGGGAAVVTPAPVTTIPAISDEGGPEARPYNYEVKPAEEAIYRNKMFELAATELRAQANAANKQNASVHKTAANTSSARTGAKSASKNAKPDFNDVSLRIFDLSSSNEPVLVLSAKTRPAAGDILAEPKEITLIARTNLEGELRKLFFSETDSRHLDVTPRMELIDAVDADGDGRGELLFRRTFDGGSAYGIYRVSADRLWPLFEGTP